MSISVKAEYRGQFRRFGIQNYITLPQFYQALSNVFLEVLEPSQITIKYQDDEQDLVTVVKEEEWQEALRVCSKMNALRVFIIERKKTNTVEKVIEKVENIVTGVVGETEKVLNKNTFDNAYQSVKSTLEEHRAQERINCVLEKCSYVLESFVNEMDKGVKTVIDQINPVQEVTIEIDPNTLQMNKYQGPPKDEVVEDEEEEVVEVSSVEVPQQPVSNAASMEQSWTFIEVGSDPTSMIRQPPKAKFIRDVTFEDDCEIECEQIIAKQWELQNISNSVWPENLKVELLEGPKSVLVSVEPVKRAQPLETVVVTANLQAPATDGSFKCLFRLSDGNVQFGPTFWCDLRAIKKATAKWADELNLLEEMGFGDVEKNKKLLEEHKGDLTNVIQAHLNAF
jgi:hypothetical protein